jgi:hypothetical protein
MSTFKSTEAIVALFKVIPSPDVVQHLLDELFCDWKALLEITHESPDGLVSKILSILPEILECFGNTKNANSLATLDSRSAMENKFSTVVSGLWTSARNTMMVPSEIEEVKEDVSIPVKELVANENPSDEKEFVDAGTYWIPTKSDKSFLRFMDQVATQDNSRVPVLKYFLENRYVFEALQFLPESVRFANIICSSLSSKISERQSFDMSVENVIDFAIQELPKNLPSLHADELKRLFGSFQKMWNYLFNVVNQFECQHLSEKYEMKLDSPGGLLLLTERNFGVYPRVYFATAVDRLNTLLEFANVQPFREHKVDDGKLSMRTYDYLSLDMQREAIKLVFSQLTERVFEMAKWSFDELTGHFQLEAVENYLISTLAILMRTVVNLEVFKFSDAFDGENIARTPLQDLSLRVTKISLSFSRNLNYSLPTAAAHRIRASLTSVERMTTATETLRTLVNLLESIDISLLKDESLLTRVAQDVSLENFVEGVGPDIARFCKLHHLPEVVSIIASLHLSSQAGNDEDVPKVDEEFNVRFAPEFVESKQIIERLHQSVQKLSWDPHKLRLVLLTECSSKLKGVSTITKNHLASQDLWAVLTLLLEEGQGGTSHKWFEHMKEQFVEFQGAHFSEFVRLLRKISESQVKRVSMDEKNASFEDIYGSKDSKLSTETFGQLVTYWNSISKELNWSVENILRTLKTAETRLFLESHPSYADLSIWDLIRRILTETQLTSISETILKNGESTFPDVKGFQLLEFIAVLEDVNRSSSSIHIVDRRIDPSQVAPPTNTALAFTHSDSIITEMEQKETEVNESEKKESEGISGLIVSAPVIEVQNRVTLEQVNTALDKKPIRPQKKLEFDDIE